MSVFIGLKIDPILMTSSMLSLVVINPEIFVYNDPLIPIMYEDIIIIINEMIIII